MNVSIRLTFFVTLIEILMLCLPLRGGYSLATSGRHSATSDAARVARQYMQTQILNYYSAPHLSGHKSAP